MQRSVAVMTWQLFTILLDGLYMLQFHRFVNEEDSFVLDSISHLKFM